MDNYSVINCRCDVGLSVRCFHLRSSKIDVSPFEDRCVDLRRLMCPSSKTEIDVKLCCYNTCQHKLPKLIIFKNNYISVLQCLFLIKPGTPVDI